MTSFEKRGQSIGRSIDNGINTAKQTVDKVGSAIRRGHEAAVDATSKAIESTAEAGRKVADWARSTYNKAVDATTRGIEAGVNAFNQNLTTIRQHSQVIANKGINILRSAGAKAETVAHILHGAARHLGRNVRDVSYNVAAGAIVITTAVGTKINIAIHSGIKSAQDGINAVKNSYNQMALQARLMIDSANNKINQTAQATIAATKNTLIKLETVGAKAYEQVVEAMLAAKNQGIAMGRAINSHAAQIRDAAYNKASQTITLTLQTGAKVSYKVGDQLKKWETDSRQATGRN